MGKEKRQYREYNDFILEESAIARDMFELYVGLYNSNTKFNKEMNIAPAFFQMTMQALLQNSVLRLAKLFENDSRSGQTVTISRLLNYVESNSKLIKPNAKMRALKIVYNSRNKILDREDDLKKLKILRDCALAHNDKKYYMKDVWSEVDLTIGSILKLFDLIAEISNEFRHLFERRKTFQKAINNDDFKNVLASISNIQSKR